jgi:dihydropteroate synthase
MIQIPLATGTITTNLPAFIMAIVNCTLDSFYDKSRGGSEQALKFISEGADIIDIGGESSRPGAAYVSAAEEIKRVVPVIKAIRNVSSVPLSIDTRKKEVMEAAFDAGADIVNDISALEDDAALGTFAALHKLPVILMHKRGNPAIMQNNTAYADVFAEVDAYLAKRASFAESIGIPAEKIIIDPGIGFGKSLDANRTLISRCGELCGSRYKVLMALSRKSCIGEMTGKPVEDRLFGTIAANMIAVERGARIVRVHDVAPCRDMLKVLGSLSDGVNKKRGGSDEHI